MDPKGLEPSTSRMRTERSTVWAGSIPPKTDRKKTKDKERISNKWDNVIVSHDESRVNPFSGCYLHLLGRAIRLASILFTPLNGKSKFIVEFQAGCSHPGLIYCKLKNAKCYSFNHHVALNEYSSRCLSTSFSNSFKSLSNSLCVPSALS